MATVNGDLYMDAVRSSNPVTDGRADHRYAGSRIHASVERAAISSGDAADSTYYVARVPREAVLLPGSFCQLEHGADMPDDISLGDADNPGGLAANYNGSAAAAVENIGPTLGDLGKPLWELLGYSDRADAPPQCDLIVTLNTTGGATADATMTVLLTYTVD